MLNLVQHLTKSMSYETLKQVQGDKSGLFTNLSILDFAISQGIKVINATVKDAGEKAFKELEITGGLPKNCRIEWSPKINLKGVTIWIE